jgi:hypothetical protein
MLFVTFFLTFIARSDFMIQSIQKICKINMIWEDGTWIADVDDENFGLVLESNSFDSLIERVKIAIKDILETDLKYTGEIRFMIQAQREDKLEALAS